MRVVSICIVIALLVFSCKKDKSSPDRKSIIGLWKKTAYTTSNAAIGTGWQSTFFLRPTFTEFTQDGKMIDKGDSVIVNNFSVTSDSTLTIHVVSANDDIPCLYSIKANELILIPLNCIEGCASKYRAVDL